MLRSLKIENYVLIDSLQLDFSSGFSTFTGETGAGKSILIDAIGIICGDRFTTDLIRSTQDKAYIEAVFDTQDDRILLQCSESGIDLSEDPLIISRELSRDGKGMTRINGKTVPVALLRSLGEVLVDIHSQHDTQYLLNTKHHLSLLDAYESDELLDVVKFAYNDYKRVADDLEDKRNHQLNPDDLEYLKFQKKEIEDASLQVGEDIILEEKQKAMMSFEKNNNRLSSALNALDEGESVSVRLHEALRHLNTLENIDQSDLISEQLSNFYHEFNELLFSIRALQDDVYFDEFEMNQIQERLFMISKLKKKFGNSIEAILMSYDEIIERISMIENRFDVIDKLEAEKKRLYGIFFEQAVKLSQKRKERAIDLENAVLEHIRDLYLEKAQFKIQFNSFEGNQTGIDQVEFLISMNPGEALKPLIKVASGGELSRLMLGLKVVFNHLQKIETVIFDEIDAGVSGRVATSIGQKMHQMSLFAQVFSVTHLAQVAVYGDEHYVVSKLQSDSSTHSNIQKLNREQRIFELSTILSGTQSENSQRAAEELLDRAEASK